MAVSSLKVCWCKFSTRVREYLDVVDSYYRPAELDTQAIETQLRSATSVDSHKATKHKRNNYYKSQSGQILDGLGANNTNSASQIASKCTNSTRPKLPPGFSKKKTAQGQIFFVASNGERFWYDPSVPKELLEAPLDLDGLVGKLSSNWEIRHTPSGKTYYVNHLKKTTQFTDPRLVAYKDYLHDILKHARYGRSPGEAAVSPPAYNHQPNSAGGGQISSANGLQPNNNTSLSSARSHQTAGTNSHQPQVPVREKNGLCSQLNNRSERYGTIFANRHTHHHHHHHYHNRAEDRYGSLNRAHNVATSRPGGTFLEAVARRPSRSVFHNQYQNLLSGSHHNLSTAPPNHNHQSDTLTRLTGSKPGHETRAQGDENSGSLSPCDNAQTTSKSRSNQQLRSSGSVNNLTSLSANISNTSSSEKFNQSSYSQQVGNGGSGCISSKVNQKELFDKISILRQELLKQQVIAHPCRIDVNRKRIFEESFRVVSQLQPRDLKKRLLVKFKGEEGLDYGGVAREWFYLLSREILNPAHGLFQYTSDDIYNLQINPDSGIVYREHLSYLNFCGRIIGMAVFHGHFIEGHFTLPFYKMLLRKSISLGDIEFVDPELFRSLCWMLENDITDVIDTTFLVQHNAFGQLQEHELKEGGRNITVTEENKHEYVTLYVNYRCRRGIESQSEALQRGFYELISPSLVENFDEAELELLIGGLSKINVDDWRRHTKLKNCTTETPLVGWFWDIVRSYSEDKRARLLQFVTGSPRVPIQGFKALQGVNSELRLFTIHLIKNACTDNLPKSHTCFNRIDLPPYENYDKLRDKLTQAIEETMGFAMQ